MAVITNTLAPKPQKTYDQGLLYRVMESLAYYQMATPAKAKSLNRNVGDTLSYRRFEQLPLALTPITEAVNPIPGSISRTEITVQPQQYGTYYVLSDRIDMLDVDPVVQEVIDMNGQQAGESVDAIIRATVITGTNVSYPTGTSRAQQSGANPLTLKKVREAVTQLRANKAKPFMGELDGKGRGGKYMAIIHPNVWHDLTYDSPVINTFTYSDPSKMYSWELDELGGVVFVCSTMAAVYPGAGVSGANVYATHIIGAEAYGAPNIGGIGKFNTFVKPLGSGGTEDPINLRSTVGWKTEQAPVILNNNFMVRIESGATLG